MKIKRVSPRLYNDYSELLDENLSEEEIIRALIHFIRHVENEEPISPILLKFMAKWAGKSLESGNYNPWDIKKRGRPTSVYSNSYLYMLAWYRAFLDPDYCKFPKSSDVDTGLYMKIAHSLNKNDPQSVQAAKLMRGIDDILLIDSESSVKRAIKQFKNNGLRVPSESDKGADIHNEHQIEIFGRRILKIEKNHEVYLLKQKIINKWLSMKK